MKPSCRLPATYRRKQQLQAQGKTVRPVSALAWTAIGMVILALLETPFFLLIGGLSVICYFLVDQDPMAWQAILIEMNRLASMPVLVALPLFYLCGHLFNGYGRPSQNHGVHAGPCGVDAGWIGHCGPLLLRLFYGPDRSKRGHHRCARRCAFTPFYDSRNIRTPFASGC